MQYSAVIQRVIEKAQALGLQVTIEEKEDDILQSVSVDIRRPVVENPTNMLEVVQNAEYIHLHSVRCFNEGRWSNSATRWGYSSVKGSWMSLRSVGYALEGMAN